MAFQRQILFGPSQWIAQANRAQNPRERERLLAMARNDESTCVLNVTGIGEALAVPSDDNPGAVKVFVDNPLHGFLYLCAGGQQVASIGVRGAEMHHSTQRQILGGLLNHLIDGEGIPTEIKAAFSRDAERLRRQLAIN